MHVSRQSAICAVVLACCAGIGFGHLVTAPAEGTISLPACATEDSTNCYWDAAHGNGEGIPFIEVDGATYYPVSETSNWTIAKCELWAGDAAPDLPENTVPGLCMTDDGQLSSAADPTTLIQLPTLAK